MEEQEVLGVDLNRSECASILAPVGSIHDPHHLAVAILAALAVPALAEPLALPKVGQSRSGLCERGGVLRRDPEDGAMPTGGDLHLQLQWAHAQF